jgi:signal transduction histidine kinase
LQLFLLAVIYWVAARLSLNLALVHGQVTPIWPPTGIALVALLVIGRWAWPAVALAAFAVNLPIGPSPLGAACIAAGNTLAPLVSAELLKRVSFHVELDRLADALAIVLLGALVGMTISATVGSGVLVAFGAVRAADFAPTWAVWWTGDAMGVLVVAPFLLSLLPRPQAVVLNWRQSSELAALLAGIGIVTYTLFQNQLRLEYLVFPLIMLAAWRFRLRGAAPAALIASGVAIWAAVSGSGPFANETLFQKMVTLQVFNVCVALASFVLASFVDTRERKEEMSRLYISARLASEAKSAFLNMAAHELRTPLSVLRGYLSMMVDGSFGPAPEPWRKPIDVLVAKSAELNKMVDDLLEASRIESQPAPASTGEADLRDAVLDAVGRAQPRADLLGAEIDVDVGAGPALVRADQAELGRILDNLINNGLTYTLRPSRLVVTLSTDGERAIVRVRDNGIGIPESQRERVFERFYRGPHQVPHNVPGTGLGLYISRQLAEAQGGMLVIESSEPGRGTVFALTLERAEAETEPLPASPLGASELPPAAAPLPPRTSPRSAGSGP